MFNYMLEIYSADHNVNRNNRFRASLKLRDQARFPFLWSDPVIPALTRLNVAGSDDPQLPDIWKILGAETADLFVSSL